MIWEGYRSPSVGVPLRWLPVCALQFLGNYLHPDWQGPLEPVKVPRANPLLHDTQIEYKVLYFSSIIFFVKSIYIALSLRYGTYLDTLSALVDAKGHP